VVENSPEGGGAKTTLTLVADIGKSGWRLIGHFHLENVTKWKGQNREMGNIGILI
jgi:hypothetical protein